jgi:3'(2'), 5'-bisphosphate nucleotidase
LGAYKISNLTKLPTQIEDFTKDENKLPIEELKDEFVVVASRSHLSDETSDFIENLKKKHNKVTTTSMGSSLKLCLVAEGKANIYPRFAPTMEWDTAAGQAIVQASGKIVKDYKTRAPLRYNKKSLLNNWFIVE